MLKTEKIILKRCHNGFLYKWLNEGTEIYNQTLYYLRQEFFEIRDGLKNGTLKQEDLKKRKWLNHFSLSNIVKNDKAFKESSLDIVVRQSAIKLACQNWKAFSKARHEWKKNPKKFKAIPGLPKYKKHGNLIGLTVDKTRIRHNKKMAENEIRLPKSNVHVILPKYIKRSSIRCLEIQPYYDRVKINVVYKSKENKTISLTKTNAIGIDIGLSNLCAITANNQRKSWIVKGGPVKSMNQYYNKKKAELKSKLEICNKTKTSKRLKRLEMKRREKIRNFFHNVSRKIVNLCLENDIGRIAIGHNPDWKQNINIGKINNQNFVSVPFNDLIRMISYKAEEAGIEVAITEESHTSKTDHIALEEMCHHDTYLGKRVKRGLFKSSCGKILNADVNGAIGILRKINAFPDAGLPGLRNRSDVVSPLVIAIQP